MGGKCGTHGENEKMHTTYSENLNERHYFRNLSVHRRKILKWILQKQGVDWIHTAEDRV
jgi:hypothetical protein